MTAIPPELLAAYRETDYRVGGDAPFVLRIGIASTALKALHERHGATCSAFLTAVNPRSQLLDARANAARQRTLARQLRHLGLHAIPGFSRHPDNDWPAEAGFLILGLDETTARRIGRLREQNAIVHCGADAVPRLVLLR